MRRHKPFTSWQFKAFLDSRQIDAETSEPRFQPQNKTHRNTALTHPNFKSSSPSQQAKNTEVGLSPSRQIEACKLKTKTWILCISHPTENTSRHSVSSSAESTKWPDPKPNSQSLLHPMGNDLTGDQWTQNKTHIEERTINWSKGQQSSVAAWNCLWKPRKHASGLAMLFSGNVALYQPCQVSPQGFSGHLSVWFPKQWKDIFTGYYFC